MSEFLESGTLKYLCWSEQLSVFFCGEYRANARMKNSFCCILFLFLVKILFERDEGWSDAMTASKLSISSRCAVF